MVTSPPPRSRRHGSALRWRKEEENNSLKDALSHADDPDYILGLARDRLGLAEDGERIFPDVNN